MIVFPELGGVVYHHPQLERSAVDLAVRVDEVQVDPEDLRARQGDAFRTEVSDHARQSTRNNMLGQRVLDAGDHPYVLIRSTGMRESADGITVRFDLSLTGETRSFEVPVTYRKERDRILAWGEFPLVQSDFGIEPYSVLGGALKVRDELELVFKLSAETIPNS